MIRYVMKTDVWYASLEPGDEIKLTLNDRVDIFGIKYQSMITKKDNSVVNIPISYFLNWIQCEIYLTFAI